MNILKLNPVVILVIVGSLHSFVMQPFSFKTDDPQVVMAAYNNKVVAISYDMQSDAEQVLSFVCAQMPICMYTPLNYKEALPDSLVKTYFLPRTELLDKNMQRFYKEIEKNLEVLGIVLVIQELVDQGHSLRIDFTIAPDSQYDIKKILDKNTKSIQFVFYKKI